MSEIDEEIEAKLNDMEKIDLINLILYLRGIKGVDRRILKF